MRELFKKAIIYGVGNIGSKLIMFILVPLYTHYLSTEDLGVYDLIWTSINLSVPIFTMQLHEAAFRWLIEGYRDKREVVISNSALGIVLFFTLTLFVSFIVLSLIQYRLSLNIYLLSFLLTMAMCVYNFMMQITRAIGYSVLYALSGFAMTLVLLVCNLIIIQTSRMQIEMILLCNVIAYFCISIFLCFKLRVWNYFKWKYLSIKVLKDMVIYSSPLVPNTISWWFINSSSKFFLFHFYGSSVNGIYAVTTKFSTILFLFNGIFNLAWQEYHISKRFDDSQFSRIFNTYVFFECLVVALIIVWIKPLIKVVVDETYYESSKYVPILLIGVCFQAFSAFMGANFMKNRQTSIIMKSSLLSGLISVASCSILIPFFGMWGAGISTLLGMLVLFIYRLQYVLKNVTFELDTKVLIASIISVSIAMLTFYGSFNINVLATFIPILFLSYFIISKNKLT
ncbi:MULTISPECIES: lipopolysaccharide biosynthesis protein [unclassified Carboxylicivirga]|uniref:lipopolysaccharide biosynthesis protein n=1 Tax=Carboxylicivirga TaxID=1628153 RepID=UPI003D32EA78